MGKTNFFKRLKLLLKSKLNIYILCFLILFPLSSYAAESVNNEALIVYYSRTGKSKVVCDEIMRNYCVDILELKDLKDRSGAWGFMGAAFDNMFDRYTEIEPKLPDLSKYSLIILVSPIWNWKMSAPIRTFLKDNILKDKKLVVFTTANIDIKKYEKFGDDAPFIKRFLRDYLRKSSKGMRLLAEDSGAEIIRHYHVETKNVTQKQIIERTLDHFADLKLNTDLKRCTPLLLQIDQNH
jgi:flavodoxin